jgi:hypothetical protein
MLPSRRYDACSSASDGREELARAIQTKIPAVSPRPVELRTGRSRRMCQ